MSARNCTAWWSSEDGRCSDDDTGAGRHACRLTDTGLGSDRERVHATCECRCGATVERPAPTLPEDLGGIDRTTVRVDERGMGKVMVGLADVSNVVSGGTVTFKAGQATTVTLGFPLAVMALSGGRGQVEAETASALKALGWTSPHEGDPLGKIADALGNHAPREIKWSTVIDVVRGLRETVELEHGNCMAVFDGDRLPDNARALIDSAAIAEARALEIANRIVADDPDVGIGALPMTRRLIAALLDAGLIKVGGEA